MADVEAGKVQPPAASGNLLTTKGMGANPNPQRDIWLTESFERGHGALLGRITPRGERRWYFRYTGSDRQVRLPIGPFAKNGDGITSFTVAQARTRALDLSSLQRSGIKDLKEHFEALAAAKNEAAELDRQRLERERRDSERQVEADRLAAERRLTVRQLFNRWQEIELKPHSRADGSRTGCKDGGAFIQAQLERRVFPKLGDVAVADVTKADVLAILDGAKAGGKLRTANVLLAALRQMFGFALDREVIEKDPTARLRKRHAGGEEVMRDRVLSAKEVKTLATALPKADMSKRSGLAVWAILATACRVGELMAARWEHVDLKGMRWHLPQTKNGRPHTIHLSAFALKQFEALHGLRPTVKDKVGTDLPAPWVFPNVALTGPVDVKTFGKQLADRQRPAEKRMAGRSKKTASLMLTGGRWTAHDLRRTAATLMAELGISGDVIDECLNHVIESRVRRIYIRDRRLADQARAFDALGARLEGLVDGTEGESNVVDLRAAA